VLYRRDPRRPGPYDLRSRRVANETRVQRIYQIVCFLFSSRTRGRPGPSGRRVRGRATAAQRINYDGATRWPAAKVITSDIKFAIWRYAF